MLKQPVTPPKAASEEIMHMQIKQLQDEVVALKSWKEKVLEDRYIKADEFKEFTDDLEILTNNLIALRERLTIFQLMQSAFTTIAGTIATILGRL
jgi:hypothetical protein